MVDVSSDFWEFVGIALEKCDIDELRMSIFYLKVKTAVENQQKLLISYSHIIEEYPPEVIASMSPPPVGVFFARDCVFFDDVDSLFKGMRDILLYWRDFRGDIVHECLQMLIDTIEIETTIGDLEL